MTTPPASAKYLQLSRNPQTRLCSIWWLDKDKRAIGCMTTADGTPLEQGSIKAAIKMTALSLRTGVPHMGDDIR